MTQRSAPRQGLLRRLRADNRGVAFLEFALIAPLLIAFYFGCVEFCLALMSQKRSNHTAAAVGDLVAQGTSLSAANLNDIFRISRTAMEPFGTARLRARVTHVTLTSTGVTSVQWSCDKNWSRRTNTSGLTFSSVHHGQSWVVSETSYSYESPIGAFMPTLTNFNTVLMYRPRLQNTVTGPNNAVAVPCPANTWA